MHNLNSFFLNIAKLFIVHESLKTQIGYPLDGSQWAEYEYI